MSVANVLPIGPEHWGQVRDLVAAIAAEGGVTPAFYWPRGLLDAELRSALGFGIFLQDQLCGFVLYRDLIDVWDISVVASHPGYRRRGMMKSLFAELVAAKGRERSLVLEVHEENLTAQNLYEKLGFREVRRRPRYYSDGGSALVYTLSDKESTE